MPLLTVCPENLCRQKKWGKGKVKRLLGTGAGLIFKGSGFYITDYRSSSYKEGAKKDAPASSDSGAGKTGGTKDAISGGSAAKKAEKKGTRHERPSALDGIPRHLPALMRVEKLVKKARKAGLLDTDGTVTPSGSVQFSVTSRRLTCRVLWHW